jgi:hypothetical protein
MPIAASVGDNRTGPEPTTINVDLIVDQHPTTAEFIVWQPTSEVQMANKCSADCNESQPNTDARISP